MRLNSFDEWSPLREVILGSADGYADHVRDLSFDSYLTDNIAGVKGYSPNISGARDGNPELPFYRIATHERFVGELIEDVEEMADLFTSLSIKVHRPAWPGRAPGDATTPMWSAPVTPPLNVRDTVLILGDEIIETPPTLRSRYFENIYLAPVLMEYFRSGARWTVMPRPLMADNPVTVGPEMRMDAANCMRLGRDLLVNVATASHSVACDWLERHLDGRFRIHRLHKLTQSHIDSTVIALRPGVLLLRSAHVVDFLPESMRKWKALVPPEPDIEDFPQYADGYPIPASPYLDLNVLSINEETVMVNQACRKLVRFLEDSKFTVIPFRHRHRRLFGGGMHCFTLDTVRDGGPEDYLS